jgi:hypothetical protein
MNIYDKKDALLFEIMKIFDETIKPIRKTKKKSNGEIYQGLNIKYFGFWVYLFVIMIYLVSPVTYIFCNKLIYSLIIFIDTIIFVLLFICEQHLPRKKIEKKTGVDYKKANYYDSFNLEVEKFNSNELEFLIKYIEYLTSEKSNVYIFKNVLSFFIPFVLIIIVEYFREKNNPAFSPNIIVNFVIGFLGIIIINIIKAMSSYEKIKLLKIEKFIRNTLLCREIENVKKES